MNWLKQHINEWVYYTGTINDASTSLTMIRKVDGYENEIWSKFYVNKPAMLSFIMDTSESYIYFISQSSISIYICKVSTSNGVIIQTIGLSTTDVIWYDDNWVLFFNSDETKIYSNGLMNSNHQANICKYPVNFSSADWYSLNDAYYIRFSLYIQSDDIYAIAKGWGTNNIKTLRAE